MYKAGVICPGGMTAIMGFDEALLAEVCRQTDTWIANINCPGQLVISGTRENLTKATDLVKDRGDYRAIPLPVSGAFHTPLMQSAVDGMAEIVANLSFHEPVIPVIGNTNAQPLTTAESVKAELLRQLCNCVQWQRSVGYMINEGVSTFIEIGPNKILTGLIRRINRDVKRINIGDVPEVKKFGQLIL